jgi:hypothetical protein
MAIDLGTETVTMNKKDKSTQAMMILDVNDVANLRFFRELLYTSGGVVKMREPLPEVQRTQTQIASKSYTAGGLTATGQQILALLNKMSDDERQIDIDAQMSSQASPEQQPAFLSAKEPIPSLPPPKPPKGKKK